MATSSDGSKPTLAQAAAGQFDLMDQTAALLEPQPARAGLKPWRAGQSLWVIAMGAASALGQVLVELLRNRGLLAINLEAQAAGRHAAAGLVADHYLLISQSGQSRETVEAAGRLGSGHRIVVTGQPRSALAAFGDVVVPLALVVDAPVYMAGNTCTMVALAALARACGHDLGDPGGLAGIARGCFDQFTGQASNAAGQLAPLSSMDVVGAAESFGAAQAAALLWREAGAMVTAAFSTRQYLHGPMEALGPNAGVVLFGQERERGIAQQLRAAGVTALVFSAAGSAVPSDPTDPTDPGRSPKPIAAGGTADPGRSPKPIAAGNTADPDASLSLPTASHAASLDFHFGPAASGLETAVAQIVFSQLIAIELATLRRVSPGQWRFPQSDTKLL
ncbi:MAG: hypothetical protein FWD29_04790 [Micrococcales bacterium]|nr:hypothetical protein [Micrococcales bacterium]